MTPDSADRDSNAAVVAQSSHSGTVSFDSVDLRLSRRGVTLRRRLGAPDPAGSAWFLELPDGPDVRLEEHRPLGPNPDSVPAALLALVRAHLRGAALSPTKLVSPAGVGPSTIEDDDPAAFRGPAGLTVARAAALVEADPLVRLDRPAAVERMLQAARRLQVVVLAPRPAAELDRLAALLAAVRDARVIGERMSALVEEQPEGSLIGPVERRVTLEVAQDNRHARLELVRELNSPGYLDLLDHLDELDYLDEPRPAEPSQGGKGTKGKKAKPGKQARKQARKHAGTAEKVQRQAEKRRDDVLLRSRLVTLSIRAHQAGENAFSYGRMHAGLDQGS